MRRGWGAFLAYRANPDPPAASANTLALVLAYNGPAFPLYLYLLAGNAYRLSLLELWSVPAFALVPYVARRHSLVGRLMLAALSTLNTVIFVLLYGARAELQMFLLPCILLGLLFPRERLLAWAVAGVPLLAFVLLRHHLHGVGRFTDAQYAAMAGLNEVSAATLVWFMAVIILPATPAPLK